MDTRQLQAFCAVVERKSFSQAAERLGVTQPAVSLQMRALEKRLGTQLLDRSGRRVEPTEAGLRLYRGAQRLLALEEQIVAELAEEATGELDGHVRDRRLDRARAASCSRSSSASSRTRTRSCTSRSASSTRRRSSSASPTGARARRRRRRAAPPRRRVRAVLPRQGHPRLPAGPPLRRPHGHARRAARRDADRHAGRRRRPADDRGRARSASACACATSTSASSSACRSR